MPKSKKPKTHFEQVPLEIIKDIPAELIPDEETDQEDPAVEPPKRIKRHSRARSSRIQRPSANRGRR
ncbi:MAG TPA: hypothetical protein VKV95_09070 [Terriglobia bacterium]|nr:hypothetical protein [Terriglobia bacterium]